jgi:transcriptional regulator with XRE-family HTH domain
MGDTGTHIRNLRVESGYTQKQLAGIIGVKESYISALERGLRRPGKKILPLLCDAFCVEEWAITCGPRARYERWLNAEQNALMIATSDFSDKQWCILTQFIQLLRTFGI